MKYKSDLVNSFYKELFRSYFDDHESIAQNAKTDYFDDFDSFEEWFDLLISIYTEEYKCDERQLRIDIKNCPEFVNDMKSEYEELKELCDDED